MFRILNTFLIIIVAILLGVGQNSYASKVFTHKKFQVKSKDDAYKNYPRNHRYLYRGVSDEMKLTRTIRAMLGDRRANLESIVFSVIKLKLMGKDPSFMDKVGKFWGKYGEDYEKKIDEALLMNTEPDKKKRRKLRKKLKVKKRIKRDDLNFFTDELAAISVTIEIINQDFIKRKSKVASRYVDYTSSQFMDYPNDPKNVIFSSIHVEVAANYRSRIVVIKEKELRSLDMTFWNFVENNKMWKHPDTDQYWVDKGEFLTPGYVPVDDIVGYEMRRNFVREMHSFNPIGNNLDWAFYRVMDSDKKFVVVINGRMASGYMAQTIIRDESGEFYYANSRFISYQSEAPPETFPVSTGEKVRIVAFLGLCSTDKECQPPTSLFSKYDNFSGSVSADDLKRVIDDIEVDNQVVKIFYKNRTIPSWKVQTPTRD